MANSRRAPGGAVLLLRILTPEELRDEMEGDLHEGFARVAAREGPAAARRWAWRQAFRVRPLALRHAVGSRSADDRRRRTITGGGMMGSGWGSDVRQALRSFRSRPAASLTVVLTVAMAVGATTAVFSVVNGVLLTPLPYPDADRLVRVWQTRPDWSSSPNPQLRAFAQHLPLSVPTLRDWKEGDTGMESLGAWGGRTFVHEGEAGAEVLQGEAVTSGFLEVWGVDPEMGRALLPEDDLPGSPRVAVLSHGLWIERFAGRNPLGEHLVLDGTPHTVVGVMPPGFRSLDEEARLWVSLTDEEKEGGRSSQFLQAVGRLAPGVGVEEAAGRLATLQARLGEAYADEQSDLGSRMVPLMDSVVGNVEATLWFLLGAVALVLLVACLNIANLLSVLGLRRRPELALRAALGAGGARLVWGLLTESAVLAGLGGLAGILLGSASLPLIRRWIPASIPRHETIALDPAVVLFGLALTAGTALLVGALPALQAARTEPYEAMITGGRGGGGGRGQSRLRGAVVAAEVALAFVLMVAAVLLATSYARLWSVERGFSSERLVLMAVSPGPQRTTDRAGTGLPLPGAAGPLEPERLVELLHERLEAIPGVEASASNHVPLSGSSSSTGFEVDRGEAEPGEVNVLITVVLEDYLDLMEIPVLQGRGLQAADDGDAPPVAVVSREMAEQLWPGESALGKRLRDDPDDPWITVVGVAGDVRHRSLDREMGSMIYLPARQSERATPAWVLRVQGDLRGAMALARQAVREVSPETPVRSIEVLDDRIARSVAVPRFRTLLVTSLAAMAALLALLGVWGVMSFTVSGRTREIAVRMALGARAHRVVGGVVLRGVGLVAAGVLAGLIAALLAADVLEGFLYDVRPTDPATYAGIAVGVLAVGALAAWLPARRGARLDPATVLRGD